MQDFKPKNKLISFKVVRNLFCNKDSIRDHSILRLHIEMSIFADAQHWFYADIVST